MRTFLAAVIALTGLAYAQEGNKPEPTPAPGNGAAPTTPSAVLRRLESVTWDPLQAQLTWFISVWDLESDMSKPREMERYVIHVNSGVMESKGQSRRFDVPGADLHTLMDIISTYAIRSTIWWGKSAGGANDPPPPSLSPDEPNAPKDKDKMNGDGKDDKPKPPAARKAIDRPQAPDGLPQHLSAQPMAGAH